MTTSMAMTHLVLTELNNNGVLRLTLNNPAKRNALSEEMMTELHRCFSEAADDDAVRVIILAAEGPAFCAGHDLRQLNEGRNASDQGASYFAKIMALCAKLMQCIVNNPKPVIAEVRGIATAAGCQLVASCDLAYAENTARFGTPGVNIGLFCSTPMVALSRNVSNKHAMEMLLTGDVINAQRAIEMGLINAAVNAEELTAKTMHIATTIASKSSKTLAIGKQAFYQQKPMTLADAYAFTADVMVNNMLIEDAKEGFNAFLEKRAATWRDE